MLKGNFREIYFVVKFVNFLCKRNIRNKVITVLIFIIMQKKIGFVIHVFRLSFTRISLLDIVYASKFQNMLNTNCNVYQQLTWNNLSMKELSEKCFKVVELNSFLDGVHESV